MEEERELDYIIADGMRRIDAAVEKVIDKHQWITPEENFAKKKYTWKLDHWPVFPSFEQRRYNYEMSEAIERMALAAPKIWPTDRNISITPKRAWNENIHSNTA